MTTYDPEWEIPAGDALTIVLPAAHDVLVAFLDDQDPSERYAESQQEVQRS